MTLNKEDIWADLQYTLDELERERSSRDIHDRLTDAANLDAQSEDEFLKRLTLIGMLSVKYSMAKTRADTKNAHEAIEKGLKAILINEGAPVRTGSDDHDLHRLLSDVEKHDPAAFGELERCFDSTIQYLESVTSLKHNTNIVDYFRTHGKAEIFVAQRYESIEGRGNRDGGMIWFIYFEMIRALKSLVLGWIPKDINSRLEEGVRKAVFAESLLDPTREPTEWLKWLDQGPVRPRLEAIDNLKNSNVLYAAVRSCARESRDIAIRYWARGIRDKLIAARRKARTERRVGSLAQ